MKAGGPSLPLALIPYHHDLFQIDVTDHVVLLEMQQIVIDFDHLTVDRCAFADDLYFLADSALQKFLHYYSSDNLIRPKIL